MRRKIAVAVAVPGLALALTACGALDGLQPGGGGQERQARSAQAETAETGGEAPRDGGTGTAGPGDQASPDTRTSAPAQQGTVIATRDAKIEGTELTADITGLRRQGRMVTLSWTITNTGDTDWSMYTRLGDESTHLGLTVAGVSLVDPVNAKRYRVARTGEGTGTKCVCSAYENSIDAGEVVTMYATYAAPPPDVQKINVEMPVLGVFTDVPIS
ncbi:hypothetical protein ACFYSC_09325 [Streptosporangium sp. NPDC004379]|uniref:hypothetical protein n=1 Tax=Streptosporangium sp. NPDC004379 TaxID=3366189 RepID=UPI0036AA7E87